MTKLRSHVPSRREVYVKNLHQNAATDEYQVIVIYRILITPFRLRLFMKPGFEGGTY